MIRRQAESIAEKYGLAKVAAVTAHNIKMDLAKFDANPANDRLKTWKAKMNHAKIKPSPTKDVKRREVRIESFTAWNSDEIARFRSR